MGLLRELGYRNVRHYVGGMADWEENGLHLEGWPAPDLAPAGRAPRGTTRPSLRTARSGRLIDALGRRSIGDLLLAWLLMILVFGLVYWTAGALPGRGLRVGTDYLTTDGGGMASAVYFSFVTALSIGYGDIVPVGPLRVLAILEGAAGLLIFGCVVSKLVSRHQEDLTEEIHRIAFEDRLGRVRSNLHLVLSELQTISRLCTDPDVSGQRVLSRVESATAVFVGELRAIHDLLYRPQQKVDEEVLETILARLAAGLGEMSDLLACLPDSQARSAVLRSNLRALSALAGEICGECVPQTYSAGLKGWMDRIQDLSRRIV